MNNDDLKVKIRAAALRSGLSHGGLDHVMLEMGASGNVPTHILCHAHGYATVHTSRDLVRSTLRDVLVDGVFGWYKGATVLVWSKMKDGFFAVACVSLGDVVDCRVVRDSGTMIGDPFDTRIG